jgi:putative DNA primase/helicase
MNNIPTNSRQQNGVAGHYLAQIKQKLSDASTKYLTSSLIKSKNQSSSINVIDVNDFIKMELPKRENILSPWLPVQGLAMIYAPRGVGKTHVALGIAHAVVSNTSFLGWQSTKARGVLYLDGEMPASLMQERLFMLMDKQMISTSVPFRLITPDLQQNNMLDLATHKSQILLEPYLNNIELIIVDNISTLCRNSKENEADSWLPVQEWALKMRASGRSVLFIHHAGKGGHQRGTSKREDILDTVIALKRPNDYKPKDGAIFEIYFEKARGFLGDAAEPIQAELVTKDTGLQEWVVRPILAQDQIIDLAKKGFKQNQIAKQVNLHKSNVSRHIKQAIQEGKLPI